MTRDISSTLPSWITTVFVPLSTTGVLLNFICSIVTVFYLYSLGDVTVSARDLIINDPISLPARVLLHGENIPLNLLRSSGSLELLLEYGFPRDHIHLGTIAVVLFHFSGIILILTTLLLIYQNLWSRRRAHMTLLQSPRDRSVTRISSDGTYHLR